MTAIYFNPRTKLFIIWALIGLALVMGYLYVVYFTNWFSKKTIQIDAKRRALPRGSEEMIYPVGFALDQSYKLTSVKVVPLVNNEHNRFTKPVWSLTTKSNSAPIRGFVYGQAIQGMIPDPQSPLQGLKPNVKYRLLLETRRVKGEKDFSAPLVLRPAPTVEE